MDIGTISVRYARALLKGATMAQQEDKVYEEMQKLFSSYTEFPQLHFTMDNPMLSKEKKQELRVQLSQKYPHQPVIEAPYTTNSEDLMKDDSSYEAIVNLMRKHSQHGHAECDHDHDHEHHHAHDHHHEHSKFFTKSIALSEETSLDQLKDLIAQLGQDALRVK